MPCTLHTVRGKFPRARKLARATTDTRDASAFESKGARVRLYKSVSSPSLPSPPLCSLQSVVFLSSIITPTNQPTSYSSKTLSQYQTLTFPPLANIPPPRIRPHVRSEARCILRRFSLVSPPPTSDRSSSVYLYCSVAALLLNFLNKALSSFSYPSQLLCFLISPSSASYTT